MGAYGDIGVRTFMDSYGVDGDSRSFDPLPEPLRWAVALNDGFVEGGGCAKINFPGKKTAKNTGGKELEKRLFPPSFLGENVFNIEKINKF